MKSLHRSSIFPFSCFAVYKWGFSLFIFLLLLISGKLMAFPATYNTFADAAPVKDIKLITHRTGPFLGISKGAFAYLEIGGEYRRKKVKLKGSVIHAFGMGFGYNFKNHYLNYTLSYWRKVGAFGLTFGGDLLGQSDFVHLQPGISPTLGFRFLGFHLQTGYQFYPVIRHQLEHNTFVIRLRFTFSGKTDRDLKR